MSDAVERAKAIIADEFAPYGPKQLLRDLVAEFERMEELAEKYRLEMIRCGKGWEDEKAVCLKAVADEPEYPGEAPPKLCAVLNKAIEEKDLDLLLHAMRQTVRLTKQCITDRIKSVRTV